MLWGWSGGDFGSCGATGGDAGRGVKEAVGGVVWGVGFSRGGTEGAGRERDAGVGVVGWGGSVKKKCGGWNAVRGLPRGGERQITALRGVDPRVLGSRFGAGGGSARGNPVGRARGVGRGWAELPGRQGRERGGPGAAEGGGGAGSVPVGAGRSEARAGPGPPPPIPPPAAPPAPRSVPTAPSSLSFPPLHPTARKCL